MRTQLDKNKLDSLNKLVGEAANIVITCHIAPDGDALGSSLGLFHILKAQGKKVTVVTPDSPPKHLMFLPGADKILVFSRYEQAVTALIQRADLVFSLDYNDPKRIDKVGNILLSAPAKKIMIDHHLFPVGFADVTISEPQLSSTSLLVYHVADRLGWHHFIGVEAATCIYTGMMTDTGNFSYNSNDPDIYEIIARLICLGIDKDRIYSEVFNSNTPSRLRLNGYAVENNMIIYPEHRAALITLDRSELNRFHYKKGDTESLVNVPLSIPEIVYSFFIREETGYIKISSRSKGEFPVNKICEEHFNGGGHKNAAGGEFFGSMQQAVDLFESLLNDNDKYLPAK